MYVCYMLFNKYSNTQNVLWYGNQCLAQKSTSGHTEGGNVTSVGWQVTLSDPIWHVSSCSGVVG